MADFHSSCRPFPKGRAHAVLFLISTLFVLTRILEHRRLTVEREGVMTSAAAAIVAKARRDVLRHFRAAGATSPEAGIAYQPERHAQSRMLDRLIESRVIARAPNGGWYLDEARLAGRRTRGLVLAASALVAIGAIILGTVLV